MPELRLTSRDKIFPWELKSIEVGGHGVVDTVGIERKAAVEPPAVDAGTVALGEFPDDGEQIARQARLIRSVIADGILPGRIVSMVAGVVVVEDEVHVARMACIG